MMGIMISYRVIMEIPHHLPIIWVSCLGTGAYREVLPLSLGTSKNYDSVK